MNSEVLGQKYNVATVYIGWLNDWLNNVDVKRLLKQDEFLNLHEDIQIELYVNDFSQKYLKDNFQYIVKRYAIKYAITLEDLLETERKRWEYLCLTYIYEHQEMSIRKKLEQLAAYWEELKHPESWRDFIYYMPAKDLSKVGSDHVYTSFLNYYKSLQNKFNQMQ
jgi:hypothetical protein